MGNEVGEAVGIKVGEAVGAVVGMTVGAAVGALVRLSHISVLRPAMNALPPRSAGSTPHNGLKAKP